MIKVEDGFPVTPPFASLCMAASAISTIAPKPELRNPKDLHHGEPSLPPQIEQDIEKLQIFVRADPNMIKAPSRAKL